MAVDLCFRRAVRADLPAIVALLTDDVLGAARESGSIAEYELAFADIDADPNHLLVVGDQDGRVVSCLQATMLPCLTHGGRRRAQFEGVRVAGDLRGHDIGHQMLDWAIIWARTQGCGMIQLTTDRRRGDACRFYETLGFVASHDGLKLTLVPAEPEV